MRLNNGFSRPVTVSASTDIVEPFKRELPGDTAVYINAFKPDKVYDARKSSKKRVLKILEDPAAVNGKFVVLNSKRIYEYKVNVPKDGRYYFMLHGKLNGRPEIYAAVNNDKLEVSKQQFKSAYTSWTMVTPGRRFGNMCRHYDLKAGTNTIKLRGMEKDAVMFDGIVLTDNPEPFEPRP